jgi:glutamate synthase domain-containing protein 1
MKVSNVPQRQGLYHPQFEHDACGIGFVVNIKGEKSNQILRQALKALVNLSHRGALGSEPNSGDGAGILMQIPHDFYKDVCAEVNITLPDAGDYGTGIVFLPHNLVMRSKIEKMFDTRHRKRRPGFSRMARRSGGPFRPGKNGQRQHAVSPSGFHRPENGRCRHGL